MVSLVTNPSQIKTVQTRGKKISNTASATKIYYYCYQYKFSVTNSTIKPRPFITLPKYITQENHCGSEKRERKQKQKSWKTSL